MILAIVSKTNGAKDTVAKYIFQNYGIPMVVSYTTRPMRGYETDGIQHYFVDDERMEKILKTEDIIAYTKNEETGIQYFATVQALTNEDIVYIINPDGIRWFKENGTNKIEMKSIYIYSKEEDILRRGRERGDDVEVLEKRLSSERAEFDEFYENKGYDYLVRNISSLDYLYGQVDAVMEILGFEKVSR